MTPLSYLSSNLLLIALETMRLLVLTFRGSLLWNSLPSNVKQSHNLEGFKVKLINLGIIHCTCVVCRRN